MNKTQTSLLTEGPITSTLIQLSLPVFLGIISIVVLNLIDAYFVGMIGELPLAALSFTFPIMMVLGSLGMGIGVGSSAMISRAIGEKNWVKTKRLTADSLILSCGCAAIFVFIGLSTIDLLFKFLGAGPEVMGYIQDYMHIWYMSVICMMATFIANNALRAKGDTKRPAYIMMGMVLINIILDPILIFGCGMEMKGAALATLIARIFSLTCSLYILHFRERLVSLTIPKFQDILSSWKSILRIGLPAATTNLVIPITAAIITKMVASYGPEAVAAFGVATKIDVFAITPIVALANVLGPFVGQNIGAKKWKRVQEGIQYSQLVSILWGFLMLIIMLAIGTSVIPFFHENEEVISILVLYLSIAPFGYSSRSLYIIGNMTLNVLNKPIIASLITVLQMLAVYLPLVFIGDHLFGIAGIFGGMALAYLFGGSTSFVVIKRILRDKEPEEPHKPEMEEELVAA